MSSHPRYMQRYQLDYTPPGHAEPQTQFVVAGQIATALTYHWPHLPAGELERLQAAALNEEPTYKWQESLGITVTHTPLTF